MRRTSLVLIAVFAVGLPSCKQDAPPTNAAAGQATASGAPFEVTVTPPAPATVGAAVAATVRLVPKNGYKVNLEYPTKLTVQAPAAGAPQSQELAKKEATKLTAAEAVFTPKTTFSAAGEHRVAATFKFSVCTDKVCEMKSEKLSWTAAIK